MNFRLPQPLLQPSIALYRLGFCVIPLRICTKIPSVKWRRFQKSRPSEETIRDWFRDIDNLNLSLGAVLGPVSDGILCRDFDTEDAYDRWKREYSDLAAILPTVQSKRGKHVYARCALSDHERLRRPQRKGACFKYDDGELRGDKHIVALPPSLHPETGKPYEWLIPPRESIPLLPIHALGFMPTSGSVTQVVTVLHAPAPSVFNSTQLPSRPPLGEGNANGSQRPEIKIVIVPSTLPSKVVSHKPPRIENLKQIFDRTVPNGPGQRNACIFALARHLKSLPQYAEADAGILKTVFSEWHRRAVHFITNKDLDWNFTEFLRAWHTVRVAAGTGSLANALERARNADIPPEAERFPVEQVRLLVKLCRELQIENGDSPFFLSCRDAATAVGITGKEPQVTAYRWLQTLCDPENGVLQLVKNGTLKGRRASEFRYLPQSPPKRS